MPKIHYTNKKVAEIFFHIADLLEIKGDVIYKILAYRKAADGITNLGQDINEVWKNGELIEIPGVGKAIKDKIEELLSTGNLRYFEELESQVPPSLVELLQVPDIGPKKVALFWKQLDIINLVELEKAARSGELQKLPGMGAKSEARILAGIEALARRANRIPLGIAYPFAMKLLNELGNIPGAEKIAASGSLRRMRSTVGDLDLIATATDSHPIIRAFIEHPDVIRVVSQGEIKASVEYNNDLRAQLWVYPPERFGAALQYTTGSKDHNVRLREMALKKGLSLSDQSFTKEDGTEILCAEEVDVYRLLEIPWIPPELREDRGEIQAAIANKLPELITLQDIQAELHSHSTWSDGELTIKEMALAARERGLKILAITDHSGGLGVAGGLSIEDIINQQEEIKAVQMELGDSILLLQGCEVEIRADGSLDYPDEILAKLDIVIASLHTSLRQPRQKITKRLLNAIQNKHVDIIGHPTGRLIPNREGADLDMDAILKAAANEKVALEINAHPSRLDLDDIYARRAIDLGIPLCINTDAHSDTGLDMLFFGVAAARRGWVEAKNVINTWNNQHILDWLENRKS